MYEVFSITLVTSVEHETDGVVIKDSLKLKILEIFGLTLASSVFCFVYLFCCVIEKVSLKLYLV